MGRPPYERLLGDAMEGETDLFARQDAVEAEWRVVDPVVGALQDPVELFEWHHDTFDPPPGATLLAGGAVYPSQAFRLGSVVAVQFHPEVDGPLLAGWWASSTPPPDYPIAPARASAIG